MTGADDSINPEELFEISETYPFVEWGILVSRNNYGRSRFPSFEWMNKLAKLNNNKLSLACHLCGSYVKEILINGLSFESEIGYLWRYFQRVQINTHGIPHRYNENAINCMKHFKKEIIFQYDGSNKDILNYALSIGLNCSTLFDLSHGAGVLPKEWIMPVEGVRCGYAGGLSPENITEQIKLIESKVGDYELWIDMETQIRSNSDQLFDLKKVGSVLDSCIETGLLK